MLMGNGSLWDISIRHRKEQQKSKQPMNGQPKERTLFFMGSKGVGKTSLIHRFLDRDDATKQTLALEYTFGRKDSKNTCTQVKDVCHIWELGGGTLFSSLLNAPLAACTDIRHLTVILMLDLSAPNQLWFTLETMLQGLLGALRKHAARDSQKLIQILQDEAWNRIGRDNLDKEYMDPFPIPLIILGGRYDIFQDFDPEKKKIVCRTLRYVAHTLGAALYFYSVKEPGLVKKTKDLLGHYGFGSPPVKSISQDYNKPLLIPAGSDSMEQIDGISAKHNEPIGRGPGGSIERWKHTFTVHFPQEASERTVMPEDPAKDVNFREPIIDALRIQKDDELERFRQDALRRQHYKQDLEWEQ